MKLTEQELKQAEEMARKRRANQEPLSESDVPEALKRVALPPGYYNSLPKEGKSAYLNAVANTSAFLALYPDLAVRLFNTSTDEAKKLDRG